MEQEKGITLPLEIIGWQGMKTWEKFIIQEDVQLEQRCMIILRGTVG